MMNLKRKIQLVVFLEVVSIILIALSKGYVLTSLPPFIDIASKAWKIIWALMLVSWLMGIFERNIWIICSLGTFYIYFNINQLIVFFENGTLFLCLGIFLQVLWISFILMHKRSDKKILKEKVLRQTYFKELGVTIGPGLIRLQETLRILTGMTSILGMTLIMFGIIGTSKIFSYFMVSVFSLSSYVMLAMLATIGSFAFLTAGTVGQLIQGIRSPKELLRIILIAPTSCLFFCIPAVYVIARGFDSMKFFKLSIAFIVGIWLIITVAWYIYLTSSVLKRLPSGFHERLEAIRLDILEAG